MDGSTHRQNPVDRKEFKQKLAGYLKITKETPERLQVWFWDESGFSLRVIRRKNWGKKGCRKKITGQRRRGRVNIMGGLRYHDKKRLNFLIKKGDSNTFYEQIKALNYSVDYNLIELVWHSAKEYIAHRLFESVEQLEELLHQLLNEGGLVIKCERKIKNKGNAVYSV